MKDIRVYDFDFNLLCIMPDTKSVSWRILYNGVGTFEGHISLIESISNVILNNKYTVIVQGDRQAICTGKIVEEELVVCGRTVNWILTKRVRPPFRASEIFGTEEYQNPETILLYCLKKGFIEPPKIGDDGIEDLESIDSDKVVSNFVIPEARGAEKLTYHFWRTSANTLEELSKELCEKMNRGHRVVFDVINKCWRFEFIYPCQTDIIVAKESKNAYDFTYSQSILDSASAGWYPLQNNLENTEGEDEANLWGYIKKEEDKKGIYFWETVLSGVGESEAKTDIEKRNQEAIINAKLRSMTLGKDYQIGNIISAYIKFGEFENMSSYRIDGVDIRLSPSESFEQPILKQI